MRTPLRRPLLERFRPRSPRPLLVAMPVVGAAVAALVGSQFAAAETGAPAVAPTVTLQVPSSVTLGATVPLQARLTVAGAPLRDRAVTFSARASDSAGGWTTLARVVTDADGWARLPSPPLAVATDLAASYDGVAAGLAASRPVTEAVSVVDLTLTAPTRVAYAGRGRVAARLSQDGAGLGGQPVQFQLRPVGARHWTAGRTVRTDADGVAALTGRWRHTVLVRARFAGAGPLAPSPARLVRLRVGAPPPRFVFPFRNVAQVQDPSTWSLDDGVDIFAVGSACGAAAPLVAVGDGTVIQTGISGFGPTAPVLRMSNGPFAGRNVYYGHTGRIFVHTGQQVRAGQLIAQVGCGQVGISAGPHLEIGVGVLGGPPCCPARGQTNREMLRQLLAALHR